LVVFCHPEQNSFAAAVRDAALTGLRNGGHDIRLTDLYAEGFDPVFSAVEHAGHLADPSTKPAIAEHVKPLLRNVGRITVATTHGSSKFVNALEGEAGKRTVTRALRALCRRTCRTRWIAFYGIDTATAVQRQRFLRRVTRRLEK